MQANPRSEAASRRSRHVTPRNIRSRHSTMVARRATGIAAACYCLLLSMCPGGGVQGFMQHQAPTYQVLHHRAAGGGGSSGGGRRAGGLAGRVESPTLKAVTAATTTTSAALAAESSPAPAESEKVRSGGRKGCRNGLRLLATRAWFMIVTHHPHPFLILSYFVEYHSQFH
jgi:hypothetical protein